MVFALAATSAAALGFSGPAHAAVTAPTAGTVIRDAGPITITEDRGARYANIAAATTANNILARGCNGAVPTRPKANATIKVIRVADGTVVASQFHETSNNTFDVNAANATGPYTATWDTTGADPGLYRIVSTANDRAKIGTGTNSTCTPDTNTVLSDFTVEYRPWQHQNFNDLLGHGKVRMNTNPREFQFTVDGSTSAVIAATPAEMKYYAAPTGLPTLPADPTVCATEPATCLPGNVTVCEPSDGCVPRLVLINRKGTDRLEGLFDLDTGAFVASATTGGKYRLLVSAGTELDAYLSDLIAESAANGSTITGLNLAALLNTNVKIDALAQSGVMQTYEIGILKGLQVTKTLSTPEGFNSINIDAPYTINAGFTTHTVAAHTYPATAPDPSENVVTKSLLVPNVPTLFSSSLGSLGSIDVVAPVPVPAPVSTITGPVLLVGGGPLVNIRSTYPNGTGKHTAGASSTGPSLDTAGGAPKRGLPAWVPGFDKATLADKGPMDFVGHAAIFLELPEINLLGTILDLGSILIGQGVTVYGESPLPALGTLPLLWDTDNPAAAQLNEVTSGLALDLLANPAVGQVLTAALSLLGGGTPDLEAVTATLSDLGSFVDLVNSVAGRAGLEAVPGLEDAVNEVGVITEAAPEPMAPAGPTWNLGPILGPLLGG